MLSSEIPCNLLLVIEYEEHF